MSELLNPHQVWPGHCAPSHCQARTGASELDILSQVQVVDIQVIFAGNPFFFQGGVSLWRLGGQAKIQYCVTQASHHDDDQAYVLQSTVWWQDHI